MVQDIFPLDLLQAINDWQIKSSIAQGQAIKNLAKNLPEKFKTCSLCCFRRLDLDKSHVWKLGNDLYLQDNISSWTYLTSVAKKFNAGVPQAGTKQGVIFSFCPEPRNVVLNLTALFSDDEFIKAIYFNRAKITNYQNGIDRFKNSEVEVILEVEKLKMEDVYALGGHSGSFEEIATIYFGHKPTAQELAEFQSLSKKAQISFGPHWVHDAAKDRVIRKMLEAIDQIKKR